MAEHLRFAVCYWHTLKGLGTDQFGANTIVRRYNKAADPMQRAEDTMHAAFEFSPSWACSSGASTTGTSPRKPGLWPRRIVA